MVFDLAMLALAAFLAATGQLAFGPALLAVAALMSSFGPVIAVANLGTTLQQTLAWRQPRTGLAGRGAGSPKRCATERTSMASREPSCDPWTSPTVTPPYSTT